MFLNMSFLLSGVSLLCPENRQMIESVSKLMLNEEEKDSHGSETGTPDKKFDCFGADIHIQPSSLFLITDKLHHPADNLLLHDGHAQNASPPPEFRERPA
jgi:hypothetical protein